MWKLVVSIIPLFIIGVSIGFLIPEYNTFSESASKETTAYSFPLLSTTKETVLPATSPAPIASQVIYTKVAEPSIDARFTGMLLHIKWLMKEGDYGGVSKEFFDKQVNSILDNISDSNDDSDTGLPSTFVVNDSGSVTSGSWLATEISDAYLSDTLTIGSGSTLANNLITPDYILAAGQTDEYCLTYEATGDTWAWQTCGSGGSGIATTSIDTSAEVASIVTDETGTGALVFAGSPNFTGIIAAAAANFSGNVGIGTTSPYAKLSVTGDLALTGGLYDSGASRGTNGMVLLSTGTGVDWVATSTLGISSGGGSLFTDGGATTYLTASGDSLAIGTSTANQKLTVEGNINLSTAGGAIYFDDARFLYASSSNHSLTFGEYAGEGFDGTDQYNVALGYYAGRLATSNYNNFIGGFAGYSSDGTHNYLIGYNSGYNNNGSTNFIVGPDAGYNSAGSNNMIFGDDAGYNNNGNENFIAGSFAGYNNAGDNNIFVGYNAARYVQGDTNIALGGEALFGSHATNFLSDNNIAIGYRAGYSADDGSGNNILIGHQAASNLTTGTNNIIIGHSISAVTAAANNRLNIGNLIFGTGLDGTGTTLSSGNVGIGTTTPTAKLQIGSYADAAYEVGGALATGTMLAIFNENPSNDYSYASLNRLRVDSAGAGDNLAAIYGEMSIFNGFSYGTSTAGEFGIYKEGAGTLSAARMLNTYFGNYSGGSVGNVYGLYLNANDGTITNNYGVYAANNTSATNNYSFYSAQNSGANNYAYYAGGTAKSYFAGSVGIGSTSPSSKLTVQNTGSGNSFIVEDQAGDSTPFVVDSEGNVAIGAPAVWNANYKMVIDKTTTTGAGYGAGISVIGDPASSGGGGYGGLDVYSQTASGNTRDKSYLFGIGTYASHYGTGVVTNVDAIYSGIDNGSTGTMTNARGLYVVDLNNTGTITNTYGLYLGDLTEGTQTNQAYSIYASDANTRNYFAGSLGIGTTTSNSKLSVIGTSTISGASDMSLTLHQLSVTPSSDQDAGYFTSSNVASDNYAYTPATNSNDIGTLVGTNNRASQLSTALASHIIASNNFAFNSQGDVTGAIIGSYVGAESDGGSVSAIQGAQVASYVYGGDVTDVQTLRIESDNSGGTVTNRYGIYIATPVGTATNDYGIYQLGGQSNYFSGNLGIGSTSPSRLLTLRATNAVDGIAIAAQLPLIDYIDLNGQDNWRTWADSSSFIISNMTDSEQRFVINDIGNIGIGSTTPTSKLTITNSGTDASFTIEDQANDLTPFVVDASGRVGIGTPTPSTALDIQGTTGTSIVAKVSSTGAAGSSQLATYSASGWSILHSNGSSANVNGVPGGAGGISFGVQPFVFAGNNAEYGRFSSDGNFGVGSTTAGSKLTIQNTGTGNSFIVEDQSGDTTPFVIDASGRVGIGLTAPYTGYLTSISDSSTITSGSKSSLLSEMVANPPSASTAYFGGAGFYTASQSGNTNAIGALYGADNFVYHNGTGLLTNAYGLNAGIDNVNTGTITNASAAKFAAYNDSASGSITTLKYLDITDLSNAGTIGNTYGLYLGDLTAGTQTNQAYSIYASDANARNYFAGKVGVGTSTPTGMLDIYESRNGGTVMNISNVNTGGSVYSEINLTAGTAGATFGVNSIASDNGLVYLISENDMLLTTGSASMRFVDSTGNIGIGTTTPAQKLQVLGNIRVGTAGGNGCLEDFAGALISGTCSSDADLKENISPIAQEGRSYLESLAALTAVTYTWNETAGDLYSKDTNFENLGLIAQDVEAQFPELVSYNDEGYRQVNFSAFPFYIIEALKEVWEKIQGHDERIENLEEENEYLKSRLEEIEDELNVTPPPAPAPTPEEPPTEGSEGDTPPPAEEPPAPPETPNNPPEADPPPEPAP